MIIATDNVSIMTYQDLYNNSYPW